MSTAKTAGAKPASTPEFVISRTLDAPRDLVWKAYTEAERLAQWWGPKGSTIRVIKLDVRPGGIFHYSMAYSAGKEMFGRFIYREITAPVRLVFVSSFSDEKGGITRAPFPQIGQTWPLEVLNETTFSEEGDKTTVSLRAVPINAIEEELATFAGMFDSMRQGFGGTFDQLDAYLAKIR
jgi:uncharacterized protein YndB with AHSA1/START domain